MAVADRKRFDEALDWVRRIHDPTFSDWEGHAVWLEADPHNLVAFDEASLMIEVATADLTPPRLRAVSSAPINDNAAGPVVAQRRWSRWGAGLGTAVAAGFVAVIAVPSMMHGGARPYMLQTGAGERHSITLADGTTIALNGDTRVRLDHGNARIAVLEQGEAFFTVKHDAEHPFAVRAGEASFQDVGTAFDVVHSAGFTQVAVREGAVLYNPDSAAVRLDGGQSLHIADNAATVATVDTAAVGGWRAGRLLYRDAPLAEVAGDVARSIGEPVTVDRALAQRRFSGVVMIDADRPLMFKRMAAAMGVEIRHAPRGGWMLMPPR
jgi:transmembrane sensor